MALNEKTRGWADSAEGKATQCKVFEVLVKLVEKFMEDGENKYYETSVVRLEKAAKEAGLAADDITYARFRLEEHKLVKSQYYSRGEGIRITKAGWDRWTKRKQ